MSFAQKVFWDYLLTLTFLLIWILSSLKISYLADTDVPDWEPVSATLNGIKTYSFWYSGEQKK